ncbi:hypothetical protein CVT24_008173 [Panaeolus cyanescens]|uniref:Prolyl 4-hydroxylase alpha subunit domain-containing protein n=1 Tax=Panaeolus cyanescens TaxID=181874 RepID=A0A409VFK1_9AGAR|nr:hypothetical protein CVT24_008173 [Panaeolus cyanescens]
MAKSFKKRKQGPLQASNLIAKKFKQEVPTANNRNGNGDGNGLDVQSLKGEIASFNGIKESDDKTGCKTDTSDMIGGVILEDELEITTDTLTLLAKNPDLLSLKALKPFKTAVHEYWRVSNEVSGVGSSLSSRISSALVDQRHIDALVLLSEMSLRGQMPKLGALQRWVRECDAVLSPGMKPEDRDMVWQVLDMILRTTQPELIADDGASSASPSSPDSPKVQGRLRWFPPFNALPLSDRQSNPTHYNLDEVVANAVSVLKPLDTTPGSQRRPPNKHPCVIYYSPPNTFPLLPVSQLISPPKRYDVPGVPGAFVITSALDPRESAALVMAAEKIGLLPDEPVGGSATQKESVLAHNFVWLADEVFERGLFDRIKELLPQEVNGGRVMGINKRFRLYRYRKGSVYRPHIDGAWPASSISETTPPTYVYDSDPKLYSRLTLLLYLNSGTPPPSSEPSSTNADSDFQPIPDPSSPLPTFTSGNTTYFLPSSTPGVLHARPILPVSGACAVFPHGAARGSLLHEGSGVGVGAKYVVRTEVLYEVREEERVNVGNG